MVGFGPTTGTTAKEPSRPKFSQVKLAVEIYFQTLPDYQAGDLISRRNVAEALDAVADAGWIVPDAEKLLLRVPSDGSFLVQQLSSNEGRKFMRKIARLPDPYSRLDQLSALPRGQKIVRDLIREKDGDLFIQYLATTTGGQNLGRMMENAKHGSDLNQPTGRIYTAEELLTALEIHYQQYTAP